MKNRFYFWAIVGLTIQLSAPMLVNGKTPPPAAPPARAPGTGAAAGANSPFGRGPTIVSPEVGTDRRVTFRFAAPNATRVTVTGISGFFGPPLAMQKDEHGFGQPRRSR